jgi:hypothetical protein
VVVVDEGKAKSMNTTTLTQDVYAFIYGQKGLMAGSASKARRSPRSIPTRKRLPEWS